jgi:hypothetical protein
MGRISAESMMAATVDEFLTMEAAMHWHLQSNCYPAVPVEMVPICLKAIERINQGNPRKRIKLPNGVRYKGASLVNPWDVVDSLCLDAFLNEETE